jgi:hypothetical protein
MRTRSKLLCEWAWSKPGEHTPDRVHSDFEPGKQSIGNKQGIPQKSMMHDRSRSQYVDRQDDSTTAQLPFYKQLHHFETRCKSIKRPGTHHGFSSSDCSFFMPPETVTENLSVNIYHNTESEEPSVTTVLIFLTLCKWLITLPVQILLHT